MRPRVALGFSSGNAGDTSAYPRGFYSLTGYAPGATVAKTVAVPVGSYALSGFAPATAAGSEIAVPAGSFSVTGYAPDASGAGNIAVPTGAVSQTLYSPATVTNRLINAPTGSIVQTGHVPGATTNRLIAAPAGSVAMTGYTPTVSSGGGAFAHDDDGSLLAWYAPEDWTTSGTNITQWNDSSGSARHLTAASGDEPQDNGNGYAEFDGTGDVMETPDFVYDNGSATVFIVIGDNNSAVNNSRLLGEYSSTNTGTIYDIFAMNSTGTTVLIRKNNFANLLSSANTETGVRSAATKIYEFVDTGSAVSVLLDGTTVTSSAAYTRSTPMDPTRLALGALWRTSQGNHHQADVLEIVITGATDSDTRDDHRTLLASTHGITL